MGIGGEASYPGWALQFGDGKSQRGYSEGGRMAARAQETHDARAVEAIEAQARQEIKARTRQMSEKRRMAGEKMGIGSEKMSKPMSKGGTKGSFTASATKAGEGVQEHARNVLAHKEDHSAKEIKKAVFARNAAKWHH